MCLIRAFAVRLACLAVFSRASPSRVTSRLSSTQRPTVVVFQVTGEAMYTDDIPSPKGTLFAGLVLSTKPHAKLLEVDPSAALEVEGVLRFVGAGDVTPERNGIGAVVVDEEVFAVHEV